MIKPYRGHLVHRIEQDDYPVAVFESWRYRWLSFGSHYIQTVIHKRKPYLPLLRYLPSFCAMVNKQSKHCLLLGLGGGAVVHYLKHHLNTKLTAIEFNHHVITIAKDYFQISNNDVEIIHQDAADYVKACKLRYDNVLIDLYGDLDYPQSCAGEDFFHHCSQLLNPDSILSLNIVNFKKQQALLEQIKKQFNNQTLCIPIPEYGNVIVHASNSNYIKQYAHNLYLQGKIKSLEWNTIFGLTGLL